LGTPPWTERAIIPQRLRECQAARGCAARNKINCPPLQPMNGTVSLLAFRSARWRLMSRPHWRINGTMGPDAPWLRCRFGAEAAFCFRLEDWLDEIWIGCVLACCDRVLRDCAASRGGGFWRNGRRGIERERGFHRCR